MTKPNLHLNPLLADKAKRTAKLKRLMALGDKVLPREDLHAARYAARLNAQPLTGDAVYDKHAIYVYEQHDPELVKAAIRARDAGHTHVMLNRRSFNARFPLTAKMEGCRTRRCYIKANFELKKGK